MQRPYGIRCARDSACPLGFFNKGVVDYVTGFFNSYALLGQVFADLDPTYVLTLTPSIPRELEYETSRKATKRLWNSFSMVSLIIHEGGYLFR